MSIIATNPNPLKQPIKTNFNRFKGFNKRINDIDIDVFHTVKAVYDEEDESKTHFKEGLEHWGSLDKGAKFNAFLKDVRPYAKSLPMILYNKDAILQTIVTHMRVYNPALKPLLNLIGALAQDLRTEMSVNFKEVFKILTEEIMNVIDPFVLEDVFSTICYVLKYLQKQFVRDIKNLYELWIPLLAHTLPYIRKFSAQSFAFLLRKVELDDLPNIIKSFLDAVKTHPSIHFKDGLAALFFQAVKGVKGEFHSRLGAIIPSLFATLDREQGKYEFNGERSPDLEARMEVVALTTLEMTLHLQKTSSTTATQSVRDIVFNEENRLFKKLKTAKGAALQHLVLQLGNIISILEMWVANDYYYKGLLAGASEDFADMVGEICSKSVLPKLPSVVVVNVLRLVSGVAHHRSDVTLNCLLVPFDQEGITFETILNYCVSLGKGIVTSEPVLSKLSAYINAKVTNENVSSVMRFLTTMCDDENIVKGVGSTPYVWPVDLPAVSEALITVIKSYNKGKNTDYSTIWGALRSLKHLKGDVKSVRKEADKFLDLMVAKDKSDITTEDRVLIGDALTSIAALQVQESKGDKALVTRATNLLNSFPDSAHVLFGVADVFTNITSDASTPAAKKRKTSTATSTSSTKKPFSELGPIVAVIGFNLSSSNNLLREATLRVIDTFEAPADHKQFITSCLTIETTEYIGTDYRQLVLIVGTFEAMIPKLPEEYLTVLFYYMMGIFYKNLTPYWEKARRVLAVMITAKFSVMWPRLIAMFKQLSAPEDKALVSGEAEEEEEGEGEEEDKKEGEEKGVEDKKKQKTPQNGKAGERPVKRRKIVTAPTAPKQSVKVKVIANLTLDYAETQLGYGKGGSVSAFVELLKELATQQNTFEAVGSVTAARKAQVQTSIWELFAEPRVNKLLEKHAAEVMPVLFEAATRKGRLEALFKLFAMIKNPQALPNADQYKALVIKMLSHPTERMRKLAFECLLTWQPPSLTPYKALLSRLFVKKYQSVTLKTLMIDEHGQAVIIEEHKRDVVDLLARIYYHNIRRRSGGVGWLSRREIFTFFGQFTTEQLQPLVALLMTPFRNLLSNPAVLSESPEALKKLMPNQAEISIVLEIIEDMLELMGLELFPFVSDFLVIVLSTLKIYEKGSDIHSMAWMRLADIFETYDAIDGEFDYARFIPTLIPIIEHEISNKLLPKGFMRCLANWAATDSLIGIYRKVPQLFPHIVAFLQKEEKYEYIHAYVVMVIDSIVMMSSTYLNEDANFILEKHAELVLRALPSSIKIKAGTNQSSKNRMAIGVRQMEVLSHMTKFAKTPSQISLVLELITPYLAVTSASDKDNTFENALKAFSNSFHVVENPRQYVELMNRLFRVVWQPHFRVMISNTFSIMAQTIPELEPVAKIISDLNAMSASGRLGEFDYQTRLKGFFKFNELFSSWTVFQIKPVVFNLIFYLNHEEYSIYSNAAASLEKLAEYSYQLYNDPKSAEADKTGIDQLIISYVLKYIEKELPIAIPAKRTEILNLFGVLVRKAPHILPDLVPLANEKDPREDFFHSLAHIQEMRQRQAMIIFDRVIRAGHVATSSVVKYFIPLFVKILIEADSDLDAITKQTEKAIGAAAQRMQWRHFLNTLKIFTGRMKSTPNLEARIVSALCTMIDSFDFAGVLNPKEEIVQMIQPRQFGKKEKRKLNFNEDEDDEETPAGEEAKTVVDAKPTPAKKGKKNFKAKGKKGKDKEEEESADEMDVDEEADPSADVDADADGKEQAQEGEKAEEEVKRKLSKEEQAELVRQEIMKDVVPLLLRRVKVLNVKKDVEYVQIAVVLAAIKLLKLLPNSDLDRILPNMVLSICVVLKQKDDKERAKARNTFLDVAAELGPHYLHYLLTELKSNLIKGYMVHVLSHTALQTLEVLEPKLNPGEIDACVPTLMEIVIDDCLGAAAEHREKSGIKTRLLEAGSSKAGPILKLLARKINFTQTINVVLDPIHFAMAESLDDQLDTILQQLTHSLAVGLLKNPSAETKDLLIFIFNTVDVFILKNDIKDTSKKAPVVEDKLKKPAKVTALETYGILPNPERTKVKVDKEQKRALNYIFGDMALNMFLALTPKLVTKINAEPETCAMVDPYLSLLFKVVKSKYTNANITAIKSLTLLIANPKLPSLQKSTFVTEVVNKIYAILTKDMNPDLTAACFQFFYHLVLTYNNKHLAYKITKQELEFILKLVVRDFEDPKKSLAVRKMLLAILEKKLEAPEVYDIMKTVQRTLVQRTADGSVARAQCIEMLTEFLVNYPLGPQRIQQHLDFFAQNLGYTEQSGRLAVLDMLSSVIANFPTHILETKAEVLFLPLLQRLINDNVLEVRQKVEEVLKALIAAVKGPARDSLFAMALSWFVKRQMDSGQRVGALVLGIFAETHIKTVTTKWDEIRQVIGWILEVGVSALGATVVKAKDSEGNTITTDMDEKAQKAQDTWQDVYAALSLLEKILRFNPALATHKDSKSMWTELIYPLIIYPHAWVRLSVARLLGRYFAQNDINELIKNVNRRSKAKQNTTVGLLEDTKMLYEMTRNFIFTLNSYHTNEEMGEQLLKNLLYLALVFYKDPAIDLPEDVKEKQIIAREERTAQRAQYFEENKYEPSAGEILNPYADAEGSSPVLHWLFRRFSHRFTAPTTKGLKPTSTQEKYYCRWLAAMVSQMESEAIRPYLVPVIASLNRLSNSPKPWLVTLAGEVSELVKKNAGSEAYFEVLGYIQKNRDVKRARRMKNANILRLKNYPEYAKQAKAKVKQTRDPRAQKKHRLSLKARSSDIVEFRKHRNANKDIL